jgi:hypothetical protein
MDVENVAPPTRSNSIFLVVACMRMILLRFISAEISTEYFGLELR